MTTKEKINKIVKDQYNDYKGTFMQPLLKVHTYMRNNMTNEKFLELLEKSVNENPRPKYNSPLKD